MYTDGTNEVIYFEHGWSKLGSAVAVRRVSGGSHFSGTFEGTYFQYVSSRSSYIFYRQGLTSGDGTVIGTAPEHTVLSCGKGALACDGGTIAVDTAGYVWIGYSTPLSDCNGCLPSFPYVTKDANTDGTWTTAPGFPAKLSNTPSGGKVGMGDWGETIPP